MTRFTGSQVHTVDGNNITVQTRPGLDLAAAAAVPGVLSDAKKTLQKALIVAGATDWKVWPCAMANRYFLTDAGNGPSKKEMEQIKTVLSRTLNGLSGDLVLKVGAVINDENGPSTLGYVSRWQGTKAAKAHQSVAKAMKPVSFPWQKQKSYVRGAIHITDATLLGELKVITLIHEATHKFAGTFDYSYFNPEGTKPDDTFTNKSKALANADSYAYFAVKVASYT